MIENKCLSSLRTRKTVIKADTSGFKGLIYSSGSTKGSQDKPEWWQDGKQDRNGEKLFQMHIWLFDNLKTPKFDCPRFSKCEKLQLNLISFLLLWFWEGGCLYLTGNTGKEKTVKENCWLSLHYSQVTKRVGGHSPIQALQQTQRVCSDETSAWVSSQTRYVCVCVDLPLCACVCASREQTNIFFSHFSLSHRHPRFPNDYSNCHLSGISLRRIWGVDFLHPRRIQRRSQSLPRPLTSQHNWYKQEMTSD